MSIAKLAPENPVAASGNLENEMTARTRTIEDGISKRSTTMRDC